MEKLLRRPALNEAVRDYVKRYIVENKLNGGDPLPPETQLAQELGVGRSSVREAIKALQSLGIVEARRGDGLYVREYNFDPILEILNYSVRSDPVRLAELMQIRVWLETVVIGDAVMEIGDAQLAQLDAVIAEWRARVQAGEDHTDLDERFHCILYGILENQTLLKLIEVFWIALDSQDVASIRASDPVAELAQHQAILEAVRARDVSTSRRLLVEHFAHLKERIRGAVSLVS
jgi:DNA-binding FadR family transcriptional regulator